MTKMSEIGAYHFISSNSLDSSWTKVFHIIWEHRNLKYEICFFFYASHCKFPSTRKFLCYGYVIKAGWICAISAEPTASQFMMAGVWCDQQRSVMLDRLTCEYVGRFAELMFSF